MSDETVGSPEAAVQSVIDTVGSKWRIVVLSRLLDGELLFADLQRSTEATAETLADVLAALEDDGLVDRRVDDDTDLETDYRCSQSLTDTGAHKTAVPDAPLATYYSLTPKGAALESVFRECETWVDQWLAVAESTPAADG